MLESSPTTHVPLAPNLPALLLIAAQTVLIIVLLLQRARIRKTETALRASETRFRTLAESTPSLIRMCDAQGTVIYVNDRRASFTGRHPDARYGDTWTSDVHPDDVQGMQEAFSEAMRKRQSFSNEYRLRRSDGVYRWMFSVASPRLNDEGSFAGLIGSAIDITDQKLAQQALEEVSGQLIEAQEEERSRIARELHDDICQRLALLSIELDQPNAPRGNIEQVRKQCFQIAHDVQTLSHRLHSPALDYLGLAAALRGFCSDIAKQQSQMKVEFREEGVPSNLSHDISICLFRIVQEAIHNAVKYSQSSLVQVELTGGVREIRLSVRDWGVGFDVEEARGNHGLGLVSMQKRIELVRGKFSIESMLGSGTRIVALVPLVDEVAGC
ncbi:MAG TPA: PAS domain-containing sensor histidine kinase [Terracidiphilus sp.]|nr:PAS domain-containing sensor histidine kinase [Terracidiphilus sp.]